jgi:hypothetical protein
MQRVGPTLVIPNIHGASSCDLTTGKQMKFQSHSKKICTKFHSSKFTTNYLCHMHSATLSTRNSTWTDLGSNPLVWCDMLMTICLSHAKTVNCQDYTASVTDE